jgi:hypothetical protein
MVIHSEQGVYKGQNHPCYGVHPVDNGLGLAFQPWCFDGAYVTWGPSFETHSEAMTHARIFAGHDV